MTVTLERMQQGVEAGRCMRCSHDLVVRRNGKYAGHLFCTNSKCRHYRYAHEAGQEVNRGHGVA